MARVARVFKTTVCYLHAGMYRSARNCEQSGKHILDKEARGDVKTDPNSEVRNRRVHKQHSARQQLTPPFDSDDSDGGMGSRSLSTLQHVDGHFSCRRILCY